MRLNRRLAPDVYLGVVPVRLGPQGHGFGADGEIVDYAVRMRRLADEHSADALLRRDALTPDHLARLAGRLARFFGDAAPAPEAGAIEIDSRQRRRELRAGGAVRGPVRLAGHVRRRAGLAARDPGAGTPPLPGAGRAGADPGRSRRPPARACLLRERRTDRDRLRRVQRATPARGCGRRRGVPGHGADRPIARRPRGAVPGRLRPGVRRPRPLRGGRLLCWIPSLGAREGRRLPGRRHVHASREGCPEGRGGPVAVHPGSLLRGGSIRDARR